MIERHVYRLQGGELVLEWDNKYLTVELRVQDESIVIHRGGDEAKLFATALGFHLEDTKQCESDGPEVTFVDEVQP